MKSVSKYPVKVGCFLMFSHKSMEHKCLEAGESWNGDWFRETAFPMVQKFMTNKRKVKNVENAVFVHDGSTNFTAKNTFLLLEKNNLKT
mgnify:FL=1